MTDAIYRDPFRHSTAPTPRRAPRCRDTPRTLIRAFAIAVAMGLLGACVPRPLSAQDAGARYAFLIGGLGGNPEYTTRFGDYLRETRSLLTDRYGFQEDHTFVLGEEALRDRSFVDGVSTAENIRLHMERLAQVVTTDDHVYLILFGHGSYDGSVARLNIPRRDLDDADYAAMLDDLSAGRIVFINTASASGPFAQALSGPDRIIITATATGTQRDETVFPKYLIEALRSPDADLDKSGGISVLELFQYAAGEAARSFEAGGHLATEHAAIEDSGDGEAARFDALDGSDDGALASVTFLRPPDALARVDEADRPLVRERESIQRSIAELKTRKDAMNEDAFYDELESLLVRLARLNDELGI